MPVRYGGAPLIGIYGNAWYVVMVERTGRVVLHTNYPRSEASESVLPGQVATSRHGKRIIQAPLTVQFAGETYQAKVFRTEKDRHGRSLGDDYEIVTP